MLDFISQRLVYMKSEDSVPVARGPWLKEEGPVPNCSFVLPLPHRLHYGFPTPSLLSPFADI